MVTIYFDKQVFSHLFKAKDEKYVALREKILSHKDEFIFLYSNAHLLDLQNDTTDTKYAEMEFIQSIVDGNCLVYEAPNIVVRKQTPRESFDTIHRIDDFSWIDDLDFATITDEQRKAIYNIVDITTKELSGELDYDWLTSRTPISSDKLFCDKTAFSAVMNLYARNLFENKESYKILRDDTIARYNPSLITADGENIFNEQFATSSIGLSFIDTVKAVLTQMGLPLSDPGTVYYTSYMLLDILGINKESRKKVRYRNVQADCCHSFFGSYCDCIVSDDEGVIRKSKTLYKLCDFGTKVYSIDEFIEKFDEAVNNNRKSAREYFDEIYYDYIVRKILRVETTTKHTITYLEAAHKYFGYFNCLAERTDEDERIIILHKSNDFNQPILVKEIEIIVNRLVRAFNDMGATSEMFNEAMELPQIKANNWERILVLDDAYMVLTIFKDTPMLCFWIKMKQPTS